MATIIKTCVWLWPQGINGYFSVEGGKWELCLYSLSRFLLCLNPTNPSQKPISPYPFSHQSSLQSSFLTPISPTNPSFEAVKTTLANLGSWMIMAWLMIWTVISTTSLLSMILFGTPNPHGRISPPCWVVLFWGFFYCTVFSYKFWCFMRKFDRNAVFYYGSNAVFYYGSYLKLEKFALMGLCLIELESLC